MLVPQLEYDCLLLPSKVLVELRAVIAGDLRFTNRTLEVLEYFSRQRSQVCFWHISNAVNLRSQRRNTIRCWRIKNRGYDCVQAPMIDQFSGEMLVGLMHLVDKILSSPDARLDNIGPEDVELERLRTLLCGGEDTALKSAMNNLIDRLKSENLDPAEVAAAMEEVKRLWPEPVPNGV